MHEQLSYVRQNTIVLSRHVLSRRISSTSGANIFSILLAAFTIYLMLDRFGDTVTRTGFTMPRRRHTCCRVALVAVAVRAIILEQGF